MEKRIQKREQEARSSCSGFLFPRMPDHTNEVYRQLMHGS